MSYNNKGSIGFLGLLGILFIALKLMHYITWSWWLVLWPIWLPLVVFAIIFFILVVVLNQGHFAWQKKKVFFLKRFSV